MITREVVMDIKVMHRNGLSIRRIARSTGMHRLTVKRHVESDSFPEYHRTKKRKSLLDPYVQLIEGYLDEDDYQATWIFDLIVRIGYPGAAGPAAGRTWSVTLRARSGASPISASRRSRPSRPRLIGATSRLSTPMEPRRPSTPSSWSLGSPGPSTWSSWKSGPSSPSWTATSTALTTWAAAPRRFSTTA